MSKNALSNFGTHFKALMDQAGMSQSELARKSGIDRSRINRMANGKLLPSEMELRCVPEALGISVEEFAAGMGAVKKPPSVKEARKELEKLYRELETAKAQANEERQRAEAAQQYARRLQQDLHAEQALRLHLEQSLRVSEEQLSVLACQVAALQNKQAQLNKAVAKAKSQQGGQAVAAMFGLLAGAALGSSSR